jgi:hypothetical protein
MYTIWPFRFTGILFLNLGKCFPTAKEFDKRMNYLGYEDNVAFLSINIYFLNLNKGFLLNKIGTRE